ncbi:MAG: uracil-DNA glycosylase [Kiritimatiellia bacterium]
MTEQAEKRECKWYRVCPMKLFFERGQLDEYWINNYCHGDHDSCVRYAMEEEGRPHPDNMLPDGSIDNTL